MKLITHNFLACNIKGVKNGFPLKIEAAKVEERDADFDPGVSHLSSTASPQQLRKCDRRDRTESHHAEFIKKIMGRVDYNALKEAAKEMGIESLPEVLETDALDDDDILHKLHHALLEVHLEEGNLICPETGRRFPVSQGIPNMLLNEDEV
jgi:multifunctional methyltransferase subunit TRM112